jgi:DNA-binding response OmpR family regulator
MWQDKSVTTGTALVIDDERQIRRVLRKALEAEIRKWSKAAMLVLSARHADEEKIAMLDAGADDTSPNRSIRSNLDECGDRLV